MNSEIIKKYGIDYESGVRRFIGDRDLYELVLRSFLDDKILDDARLAMKHKDYHRLFECAHEIKGSSSNADMYELCSASGKLVELLRNGNYDDISVEECFDCFVTAYERAKEGIKLAQEGSE